MREILKLTIQNIREWAAIHESKELVAKLKVIQRRNNCILSRAAIKVIHEELTSRRTA